MKHKTYETLEECLKDGKTPCGDENEDGSGRGICAAGDGSMYSYSYTRTKEGYAITGWEQVSKPH